MLPALLAWSGPLTRSHPCTQEAPPAGGHRSPWLPVAGAAAALALLLLPSSIRPRWPADPLPELLPWITGPPPCWPAGCLLPELQQRWPCSCCRRRSGHAGRRRAGHGRRHGPPWPSCCCPCNDHATQHATHHAAAASRRRAARPRKQHRRCCLYRNAMHHHATRTPQVATPTVLPLSLRSSCARAFHEATPPGSRKKFPGTQYQKGTVFREKISCGVGEPKIWLVF